MVYTLLATAPDRWLAPAGLPTALLIATALLRSVEGPATPLATRLRSEPDGLCFGVQGAHLQPLPMGISRSSHCRHSHSPSMAIAASPITLTTHL